MRLDALKPNGAAQAHPGRRETGPYKALRCPRGIEPAPQSHGQPEKSTIKIPQGRICYNQSHQKVTASRKAAPIPAAPTHGWLLGWDGILPIRGWSAQLPHHPGLHYSSLPSLFPLLYKRRDIFKNISAYF